MKTLFRKSWLILDYLIYRLFHEGLINRAGALAYTTILAIVPMMLAIATLLSYFPVFSGMANQIQQIILTHFVADSAHLISAHLTQFLHNVRHISAFNIYLLIGLDVLMLYNIHEVFNDVWRVKPHWHFSLSFLIYLIVLMLSPFLLAGILVLGGTLYKFAFIKALVGLPGLGKHSLTLGSLAMSMATFTLINWILPSCRVKFRHALCGGLITTLIFEFGKNLFAFSLAHFHTYRQLYGALATFPIFLIWLYVSWLIILVGTLVTHLIAVGLPKSWQQKFRE